MNSYIYTNEKGHPYLYGTVGVCNHGDSARINKYFKAVASTQDHPTGCKCTTCGDLNVEGEKMVVYSTIAKDIDGENPTDFRVKIKNLSQKLN